MHKPTFNQIIGAVAGVVGQQAWITPGVFPFIVPDNVTSLSGVAVAGGQGGSSSVIAYGGAGGDLRWAASVPVTPGETLTIRVGAGSTTFESSGSVSFVSSISRGSTVLLAADTASSSPNASTAIDGVNIGGGNGGLGGILVSGSGGTGGGGAGGYSGNGGKGANTASALVAADGTAGAGGAGGGGASGTQTGAKGGGGGVGIFGAGPSGTGGLAASSTQQGGRGGSSGTAGGTTTNASVTTPVGGTYGGGGPGSGSGYWGAGAGGAVRIIWGSGRSYPSTNTNDV